MITQGSEASHVGKKQHHTENGVNANNAYFKGTAVQRRMMSFINLCMVAGVSSRTMAKLRRSMSAVVRATDEARSRLAFTKETKHRYQSDGPLLSVSEHQVFAAELQRIRDQVVLPMFRRMRNRRAPKYMDKAMDAFLNGIDKVRCWAEELACQEHPSIDINGLYYGRSQNTDNPQEGAPKS